MDSQTFVWKIHKPPNINQLSLSSITGAKINLERDVDPTLNGLRRVQISGASTQVDYAKLLIEEKVEVAKKLKVKDELRGRFKHHLLYTCVCVLFLDLLKK